MQQNTPEWLEMRKSMIGASDAPIIMGVSPWKTPFQLYMEKEGLAEPTITTAAMQRGHDLEETARQCFEEMMDVLVFPDVKFHPTIPYMMASMDGVSMDGAVAVEIKVANVIDHSLAVDGKIPEKYYPQLQHQMAVGGWPSMHYFSYNGTEGVCVHVLRDQPYIDQLLAKEAEFQDCRTRGVAPPLSDRDYITREDDEWTHLASAYLTAKESMELLTEILENTKKGLVRLAGSSNVKGAGIALSRSLRKGTVDYAGIPELKGVDLEKHRKKPIETWTVRKANGEQ
jgi:putative phage-type endonuclease